MRPLPAACVLVLGACATTPAGRGAEEIRVETVTLDLLPEGTGTVGFLLELESPPGESCTVTRVEWQMMLGGRDFAAGVASANVLVPGGQHARVRVEEPVAFGGMAYDGRARTIPVALRGHALTQWSWGEAKRHFELRTRVAVRGAPVYDR